MTMCSLCFAVAHDARRFAGSTASRAQDPVCATRWFIPFAVELERDMTRYVMFLGIRSEGNGVMWCEYEDHHGIHARHGLRFCSGRAWRNALVSVQLTNDGDAHLGQWEMCARNALGAFHVRWYRCAYVCTFALVASLANLRPRFVVLT
jgi:hypothetical protein